MQVFGEKNVQRIVTNRWGTVPVRRVAAGWPRLLAIGVTESQEVAHPRPMTIKGHGMIIPFTKPRNHLLQAAPAQVASNLDLPSRTASAFAICATRRVPIGWVE